LTSCFIIDYPPDPAKYRSLVAQGGAELVSDRPEAPRRVLIVDQSEDAREVLRTVLQRRGVQIYEASAVRVGLELASQYQPDVIVLDAETVSPQDHGVCGGFDDHARRDNTALVLLGTLRSPRGTAAAAQVVGKPYHYGPLIRTIELLLIRDSGHCRSAE
jgi:DNA-binding response OmpR family regulator